MNWFFLYERKVDWLPWGTSWLQSTSWVDCSMKSRGWAHWLDWASSTGRTPKRSRWIWLSTNQWGGARSSCSERNGAAWTFQLGEKLIRRGMALPSTLSRWGYTWQCGSVNTASLHRICVIKKGWYGRVSHRMLYTQESEVSSKNLRESLVIYFKKSYSKLGEGILNELQLTME